MVVHLVQNDTVYLHKIKSNLLNNNGDIDVKEMVRRMRQSGLVVNVDNSKKDDSRYSSKLTDILVFLRGYRGYLDKEVISLVRSLAE